jgi:hypothetical protein
LNALLVGQTLKLLLVSHALKASAEFGMVNDVVTAVGEWYNANNVAVFSNIELVYGT